MRIVVDTNIIISAIYFGGVPRVLFELFEEIAHFIRVLKEKTLFIQPSHRKKYSRDPDDDKFIHCAQSGKAIYIVSGDSDLLDLDKIDDIEMLTAREFLNLIQGS